MIQAISPHWGGRGQSPGMIIALPRPRLALRHLRRLVPMPTATLHGRTCPPAHASHRLPCPPDHMPCWQRELVGVPRPPPTTSRLREGHYAPRPLDAPDPLTWEPVTPTTPEHGMLYFTGAATHCGGPRRAAVPGCGGGGPLLIHRVTRGPAVPGGETAEGTRRGGGR